jgi:hypothetical protein
VMLLVRTLDNAWEDDEVAAELRGLAIVWERSGKSDGSTLKRRSADGFPVNGSPTEWAAESRSANASGTSCE